VTSDPESDALHARARAFVRAFEAGERMPESFDALACDLARFQASRVPGYAKLCRARGVDVAGLARAGDAPAVPTDAFKMTRIAAFPEESTHVTFRTSGTTVGARGAHAMRDAGTYDAAALAFGRWALAAGFRGRVPVLVLGPPPREATDSSLTHMNALFVQHLGTPASERETYFVQDDVLDIVALDERIVRTMAIGESPVLVLATSFALVHLLDALEGAPFRLPKGSRVMQTGGFKGRSREVDGERLRRDVARAFHVDERAIVGEYGMTELSSQFYEATIARPAAEPWVYVEPPWARVVPVDPVTLAPVPKGKIGVARIEDLMNVDSAFAVLAADRVRRVGGGFELLGRSEGAPPRGCSIAIDEILGR
jgi:Acyl-protein synthetase, LuxE